MTEHIPMRWIKWAVVTCLIAALGVVFVLWGTARWRTDGDLGDLILPVLGAIPMFGSLLGMAHFGRRAERAGFLMRMDESGLHHCLIPFIRWTEVSGVDLVQGDGEKGTCWRMVLAVKPDLARSLARPWWDRVFVWIRPQADPRRNMLSIPFDYAKGSPHQVAGMARIFVERTGKSLGPVKWRNGSDPGRVVADAEGMQR